MKNQLVSFLCLALAASLLPGCSKKRSKMAKDGSWSGVLCQYGQPLWSGVIFPKTCCLQVN